jgi:hypothetical protein
MLYIVEGEIHITRYMRDHADKVRKVRLVDALNELDAEHKYVKYFEDKSSDYDVYYRATVHEVSSIIS